MKKIYLTLFDIKNKKQFKKYFDTEFDKDKFLRKLKFSSKILVINDYKSNFD